MAHARVSIANDDAENIHMRRNNNGIRHALHWLSSSAGIQNRNKHCFPSSVALEDIWKYQQSTNLLVLKLLFCRAAKEILFDCSACLWIEGSVALADQKAAEDYSVWFFEDANFHATHCHCAKISSKYFALVRCIRGEWF